MICASKLEKMSNRYFNLGETGVNEPEATLATERTVVLCSIISYVSYLSVSARG